MDPLSGIGRKALLENRRHEFVLEDGQQVAPDIEQVYRLAESRDERELSMSVLEHGIA